jgi:murein DD-endopeptidase MepM/ murein hydrolase activator NlpD
VQRTGRFRDIALAPYIVAGVVLCVASGACGDAAPPEKTSAAPPAAVAAVPSEGADAGRAAPPNAGTSVAPPANASTRWFPTFASSPLDTSLRVTSGFGDYRGTHFHAGLDFSTGEVVGKEVHAPGDGVVRRVRASGVGYGRSLYLELRDGRLIVFGHLDAFAEPLASWVASIQDSSGRYEQDLWLEGDRFPVHAGDVVAWSGQSGVGPPHLHMEVRRADMALNPFFSGIVAADTTRPRIWSVGLEPLDDSSFVASPPVRAFTFGYRDTLPAPVLRARGRVRAVVEVSDARNDGRGWVMPYDVRLEYVSAPGAGAPFVECRFDSLSWASDMPEADFVYDRRGPGPRGNRTLVMWAPPRFRPRVMHASTPIEAEVGVIELADTAQALTLRVTATDAAGNKAQRAVVARGAAMSERPPKTVEAPLALRRIEMLGVRAELSAAGVARADLSPSTLFSPVTLTLRSEWAPAGRGVPKHKGHPTGLAATDARVVFAPETTPLRNAVRITLNYPNDIASEHLGLYRRSGADWDWVGEDRDTVAHTVTGETRHLGTFAVLRDDAAPVIRSIRMRGSRAASKPYSRWAIEAGVSESGSGVDARASYLTFDGRRVPTEWDPDAAVLRWRPLHAPNAGSHRVEVVALDRSGWRGIQARNVVVE